MKFDDLDHKMRTYESLNDSYVLPCIRMVARLDGRSFTRLTRQTHAFAAPFDERFRDYMVETTVHLMDCGFNGLFGYTQSDEISLLFDLDENTFGRKLRKLNSVLAGEASGKFSTLLGAPAAFDCRICQLPSVELVVDYFRWRSEDAVRNALNGHCYWALRKQGFDAALANDKLLKLSVAEKNELLYQTAGLNFNDLPPWQKRGVGVYWERYTKAAENPRTAEAVTATRRRLKRDLELPMKEQFSAFVHSFMR